MTDKQKLWQDICTHDQNLKKLLEEVKRVFGGGVIKNVKLKQEE